MYDNTRSFSFILITHQYKKTTIHSRPIDGEGWKTPKIKKVTLPSITSPKCQCDAK